MNEIEILTERNRQFASSYTNQLPLMPRFSTIILTCIDARVDPAHVLGLEAGEALVMRTGGGRVNKEIALELGILSMMARRALGEQFQGFSLAIVHHTDCGFERLANPQIGAGISQGLGIEASKIDALAIHDHTQSLKDDFARLQHSPHVPKNLTVGGYLFDVETGLLKEVIPSERLAVPSQ
ncbi:MAG: hypothetical protein QNJ45_13150 [Ardenticatenaceae bacterium]|nr:hypothetical protein [Ardenticatenaceae bacterium]